MSTLKAVIPAPTPAPKPPKKFNADSYAFEKALARRGFNCIGSGFFSSVYAKEGQEKVIKVGRKPKEDGWLDYILWAKQSGWMGKFAPIVYSYKYHKGSDWNSNNAFYVAVVERLHRGEADRAMVGELFSYKAQSKKSGPLAARILDTAVPGLNAFADEFLREFKDLASLDLHSGNSMARKDGSFVLTDPLSSPKVLYKQRIKAEAAPAALAA